MGNPRFTYGSRSLAALGLALLETEAFHPLIRIPLERGQTASWLLALGAAVFMALLLWPVAAALGKIPGGTLGDLAKRALGRPGIIITSLLLTGMYTFAGGMILRETSEMAISAAFPHTPQTFATTALLLGAVYVAYGDGSGLVRMGRYMLPPILLTLLVVLAGSVGWGKAQYLLPFWGPGPMRLLANVPITAGMFAPLVLLFEMTGEVSNRSALVRWLVAVPLLGGNILALIKAVLGMVFPYPQGSVITYPLFVAARIILGGRFFERLDGLWLFMWVWSTIVLSGALLYGSSLSISRAFGLPRHQLAVPPLATVVLTVAFFPRNQAQTVLIHEAYALPAFILSGGLPLLLTVIAAFRKGKTDHET